MSPPNENSPVRKSVCCTHRSVPGTFIPLPLAALPLRTLANGSPLQAFSFPPRADCPECLSGSFVYREVSGRGSVYTYSTVAAAPTGFDDIAPYTIAVVNLEEGGRLLAWTGDTIDEVEIGMPVRVVPRIFEEVEDIRVDSTVEHPGTTWGKAPGVGYSADGGSKDRIPVK